MLTSADECQFDVQGFLAFALLVAIPLAAALSWATLQLYRRAVDKSMRLSAGTTIPIPRHRGKVERFRPAKLTLKFLEGGQHDLHRAATPLRRRGETTLCRLNAIYALAGSAHAAVVTTLRFLFDGTEFSPLRFGVVWLVYAWPIIPLLALMAVGRRRTKLSMLAAYFGALLVLGAVMHVGGNIDGESWHLLQLWVLLMAPPTLILWLLSNRALRCVGLIALIVTITLSVAWFGSFQLLGCFVVSTRSEVLVQWFTPLLVLVLLAVAFAVWLLLRRVAIRLQRAQTSDLMLAADSWWLLITLVEMLMLSPSMKEAAPLLLLAFGAYKSVIGAGLLWAREHDAEGYAPTLLVLRVFGYARRTERLLDEVGLRWRCIGPVNLIAGADIATSFLDPGELVQFASGRLGDAYIADEPMLQAKLERAADSVSADGRHGLNEFFCRDNSWRACVHALAARSDAVLMDLRGFGATNRGCEFELGLLIEHVDIENVVIVVDRSSDIAHLEEVLTTAWGQHSVCGANASAVRPTVYLMRGEEHGVALGDRVLDRLFALARQGREGLHREGA